ncbi:MAG: hypothetical protein AAFX07_00625 [Pseudomonadota bacterium]
MSLEAWGDENPIDADFDSWIDRAIDAGWFDPDDLSPGARDVLAERERQETKEGWTLAHDDQHSNGQLALAADSYCFNAALYQHLNDAIDNRVYRSTPVPINWPFDGERWKPKSPREDLVRAAALIIAEIERLDRAAARAAADDDPSGDGLE